LGSCLAQSSRRRTGNGRSITPSSAVFSAVRISLRSGVFFGDTSDHEFESVVLRAPVQDFSSGEERFNQLK
jgi:hypothetical protein